MEHNETPMTLSHAAQAVLDAMFKVNLDFGVVLLNSGEEAKLAAAALRAAADQPYEVPTWIRGDDYWTYRNAIESERERNRTIAAELEGFSE